jgi:hypothetical protein
LATIFKNDIHATAARRFQYFFLIARFAVIENLLRSFALYQVEAFLLAGGAQDSEAHGARDLERRCADTATRPVH